MYCGKCGKQIETGEKYCGSCGAAADAQQLSPPCPAPDYSSAEIRAVKNPRYKRVGVIACAVVVVIALVVVVSLFTQSEKPEVVTEKYLTATMDFDYDALCRYGAVSAEAVLSAAVRSSSLSETEVKEKLLDEYGMTDIKKIYEGPLKEEAQKSLKKEFGADYRISVSISGTAELSDSQIKDELSSLRDSAGKLDIDIEELIPISKIKDMCCVRGSLIAEGSLKKDTKAFELNCAKIGGKWKVLGNPLSSTLY